MEIDRPTVGPTNAVVETSSRRLKRSREEEGEGKEETKGKKTWKGEKINGRNGGIIHKRNGKEINTVEKCLEMEEEIT